RTAAGAPRPRSALLQFALPELVARRRDQLAVQRLLKIVEDVDLLVPPGRVRPHPRQVRQERDLLSVMLLVEFPNGTQFADVVVVTGMLRPDGVIKITADSR